jgi:hypothetical protein
MRLYSSFLAGASTGEDAAADVGDLAGAGDEAAAKAGEVCTGFSVAGSVGVTVGVKASFVGGAPGDDASPDEDVFSWVPLPGVEFPDTSGGVD